MPALPEAGWIQAMTEAIAEADAEIGGVRMTRTTAVIADGTDLAGAYQWPGGSTTPQVVLVNDTSDVVAGDWIGFRTDEQMWEIDLVVPNVSVRLLNPNGLTYPTAGIPPGTSFKATTTFPVETTHEWPSAGKIALDSVVYAYTGKTATTFTGVTHVLAGTTVIGSARAHRDETTVTDISKSWSALDLLRRAVLVNYAEEENLDAVGSNLGVDRVRLFTSDDQYRAAIKALAYNPRGTMYGLELALDALVGAGNYEIYEDLINFPNIVFIILTAGYTGAASAGSTYLTGPEWDDLAGAPPDTLALSATPLGVEGVVLFAMDELFDFRSLIPSAVTYDYYPGVGAPANAFTYAGGEVEGAAVSATGTETKMWSTAAGTVYYRMTDVQGARLTEASFVEVNFLMYIPAAANKKAGEYAQASIAIYDGNYRISFGVDDTDEAGLYKTMVGGFLGTTFIFADDTFYDVTVRKYDNRYVELLVNGKFITRVDYESFNQVTANHYVEFGIRGVPNINMRMWTKQIGIAHRTPTDYWNARGLVGTVGLAATGNATRFDANTGGAIFIAGDVDKRVQLSGSAITNPTGGNNNGIWKIGSLVGGPPSDIVELIGDDKTGADILDFTNHPKRITISDDDEAFTFPDDLGKQITLSGSTLGNNLTRTIEKLFEPGTSRNLLTYYDTGDQVTLKTNVCAVSVNLAATESNLDYHLVPVFANEAAALDWELSDAGSIAVATLTLRQGLWVNGLIMEIRISNVLTGQIQETSVVTNVASAPPPPHTYEIYPFYLSDPFGLVRAYIDAITAAGVKPEYGIEG